MSSESDAPGLRADARRNRRVLIDTAREVFVEQGADARLGTIAERAGVGIATLYRHFPDRQSLIRQVVIENTREQLAEATAAIAEEDTSWNALVRYANRVVERRLGLLKPVLGGKFQPDEEFREIQQPLLTALEGLVAQAQCDGDLRSDVGFGDIQMLITLISRSMPTASRELTDHVARRYLDLILQGLHLTDGPALPTPMITTTDAEQMCLPTAHPGR